MVEGEVQGVLPITATVLSNLIIDCMVLAKQENLRSKTLLYPAKAMETITKCLRSAHWADMKILFVHRVVISHTGEMLGIYQRLDDDQQI